MRVWVDADACPYPIKQILFRLADRLGVEVALVANQPLSVPRSPYVRTIQAPPGFDEADNKIIEFAEADDLVITADIPLAAAVVEKGAFALDPRGELFSDENISERLAVRNLLNNIRGTGVDLGGPPPFDNRDIQRFANGLDRFVSRHHRREGPSRDSGTPPLDS